MRGSADPTNRSAPSEPLRMRSPRTERSTAERLIGTSTDSRNTTFGLSADRPARATRGLLENNRRRATRQEGEMCCVLRRTLWES